MATPLGYPGPARACLAPARLLSPGWPWLAWLSSPGSLLTYPRHPLTNGAQVPVTIGAALLMPLTRIK
jgi:hypothetical protein